CNLVLNPSFFRIHQIKMPPTIPLGHVNHLVGIFQPVDISEVQALGMSGPDKGFTFFVNQISQGARLRIRFNHAISLLTTIRLYISKMTLVLHPVKIRRFPTMFKAVELGLYLFSPANVKNA